MPEPDGARPPSAPDEAGWTPAERSLAAIWQELLDVEIDRTDDFFDVGGDSLVAMRVVSWVRQRLGVRLTVREVYTLRRLADLATVVEQRSVRK
jgi:acyl carrier protein